METNIVERGFHPQPCRWHDEICLNWPLPDGDFIVDLVQSLRGSVTEMLMAVCPMKSLKPEDVNGLLGEIQYVREICKTLSDEALNLSHSLGGRAEDIEYRFLVKGEG